MAGIAGIDESKEDAVTQMLSRLTHRGEAGSKIVRGKDATLGAVWPRTQMVPTPAMLRRQAAWDGEQPPLPEAQQLGQEPDPFAMAAINLPHSLFLARDALGICPLYYGYTAGGSFCFASEVKALLEVTQDVHVFPPGTMYTSEAGFSDYAPSSSPPLLEAESDELAEGLRLRLERAVIRRITGNEMGSWLSGGLDSSAIVALASPHLSTLHTFAAGLAGAPDLKFAQEVADYFGTVHHPVIVTPEQIVDALPAVIYHLESFDALLVRSSITNYLMARVASDYSGAVFSGEGADELFAGYSYLQHIPAAEIKGELSDITRRLHNTALQRVDRSAAAHGMVTYVPFLDPEVVAYAQRIPAHLKLRRGKKTVEKWILRRALDDALPASVLWRPKAKFWQGTGMDELLARHADRRITDADFRRERRLPNGWTLNSKEELLYYRHFKAHFGELANLDWMGRTKGAPTA